MTRVTGAEAVETYWVDEIDDITEPTAAELNAGIRLTGFIPDGGLDTPNTGQTVDISDMSSLFNKTTAGTYGGDTVSVTVYRDNDADTAYEALQIRSSGFLVVSRFGQATPGTWAVADEADIYPVTVITRNPAPIGRNEAQRATVEMAVTDVPLEAVAVVAAP